MMMRFTTALAVGGLLAATSSGHATLLCAKKSGAVVLRASACNKKETALDPAALGLVGSKGDKGDPGPLITPESWHEIGASGEPAFRGGAVNALAQWVCSGPEPQPDGCPTYETVGFYKDPFAVVHFKGSLRLGNDSIPFTLPAGYQPLQARAFRVTVHPEGTIATLVIYDQYVQIIQSAGYTGNEVYSLDNVSFLAGK